MNKKDNRLTLYRIAQLVANGIKPEGYEIEWFGAEPGIAFDEVVGSEITGISRDTVPVPEMIHVRGLNYVDLLMDYSPLVVDEEKVDFGKVTLRTRFRIDSITFFYPAKDRWKVDKWWHEQMDDLGSVKMKKDVVFDLTYDLYGMKRTMYNSWLSGVKYPEPDDENGMVEASVTCDWMKTDF